MSGFLENLLSAGEVAERTGLSKAWWQARARSKQVAHYRLGGVYKFFWDDIEAALASTKVEAEEDIKISKRGRKGASKPKSEKGGK
jgi:hypothetical protein